MLQNAYFLAKIGADTAENKATFTAAVIQPKTTNDLPAAGALRVARAAAEAATSGAQGGSEASPTGKHSLSHLFFTLQWSDSDRKPPCLKAHFSGLFIFENILVSFLSSLRDFLSARSKLSNFDFRNLFGIHE